MDAMKKQLFFVALSFVFHAQAVNHVFDEFFFSKDTWDSWKLENPLAEVNPSDFLPRAKEDYPSIENAEYNSIDGPRSRLRIVKKPASVSLASDVEALDDDNVIEHAAKAAQCMTCHVLATVVWTRLTNDILSGEDATRGLVRSHLEDSCEKDAVDVMLRKYTILKMESAGGASALTFVVVRERRDGGMGASATDTEEATVTLACKNLVKESGEDLVTELMDQLANFRREAVRLLVKYDRDGGNPPDEPPQLTPPTGTPASSAGAGAGSGSGSSGRLPRLGGSGTAAGQEDDDDYVDPDDLDEAGNPRVTKTAAAGAKKAAGSGSGAGPSKAAAQAKAGSPSGSSAARVIRGLVFKVQPGESECADLNPRCADWAAAGECKNNPPYMIGTDKHRGHCRKSCGVCHPVDVLSGNPALAAEMEKLAAALLLAVKNLGCGASGACLTGVSGMAMGTGLLKQHLQQQQMQLPKRELPPGMKEFPGGFILGKPWWGIPEIRQVRSTPDRKPGSPSAADSSSSSSSSSPSSGSSGPSHAEVDRVLAPVLANKLLSIPSDFFVYEYLYRNHTRHYHPEDDGTITEDWLLGKFTRESVSLMSSVTGEVAGLEELDQLPGGPHTELFRAHTWPYVKQVYAGGDECVLAGGRRVVRRVEARIACSPDANTYMLIREPDFCTYTFVIFVPQLCTLDYYRPKYKPGPGGQGSQESGRAAGQQEGGAAEKGPGSV